MVLSYPWPAGATRSALDAALQELLGALELLELGVDGVDALAITSVESVGMKTSVVVGMEDG